jgi:proteasome lid subunit RPN8/RPN11
MSKVSYEIVCSDELLAQIEEHCFSQVRTEVGGFLVGEMVDGKSVVTHVLRAKHTAAQITQVTFTHKTWDTAFAEMAKIKPDAELIGWYHSHPNFGVFLSDHDKFIQTQFFAPDGRITIVVDPIRGKRGWFISRDKEVVPYAPEEDTTLERLGESESDSDKNIPVITGSPTSGGISLGKVLAISAIFSLLSMFGGFTLANSSNSNAVQIGNLERDLSYVLRVLQDNGLTVQTVEPEIIVPTAPPTTQNPTANPSSTVKSSPKAETPKSSTSPQATKTIICYKAGAKNQNIVAVNPKCPAGYTTTKPSGKASTPPTGKASTQPTTPATSQPTTPATSQPTVVASPSAGNSEGATQP